MNRMAHQLFHPNMKIVWNKCEIITLIKIGHDQNLRKVMEKSFPSNIMEVVNKFLEILLLCVTVGPKITGLIDEQTCYGSHTKK
jgi:hypothetical protein